MDRQSCLVACSIDVLVQVHGQAEIRLTAAAKKVPLERGLDQIEAPSGIFGGQRASEMGDSGLSAAS